MRRKCPVCKGLKGLWKVPNAYEEFAQFMPEPPRIHAVRCTTCKGSGFVITDQAGRVIEACEPEFISLGR